MVIDVELAPCVWTCIMAYAVPPTILATIPCRERHGVRQNDLLPLDIIVLIRCYSPHTRFYNGVLPIVAVSETPADHLDGLTKSDTLLLIKQLREAQAYPVTATSLTTWGPLDIQRGFRGRPPAGLRLRVHGVILTWAGHSRSLSETHDGKGVREAIE